MDIDAVEEWLNIELRCEPERRMRTITISSALSRRKRSKPVICDECVEPSVYERLVGLGLEVHRPMCGTPDNEIMGWAHEIDAVIVTKDLHDFNEYPGLVKYRSNESWRKVCNRIEKIMRQENCACSIRA